MTVTEEKAILIRPDRVDAIRLEVTKGLDSLYARLDFNVAEILVAFSEVIIRQRHIGDYLETMR